MLADATLDVIIGEGAARAVRFVDADGTAAKISVKGGAATVRFTGEGLAQAADGREAVVSGAGVAVAEIAAARTTSRTAVTLSAAGGDGQIRVGTINSDGPLRSLRGPGVVLTGRLIAGGSVRRLELLRAENATVAIGGAGGPSSISIREAHDTALTSAAPLRRVDLYVWSGGAITAPSVGKVKCTGFFKGDIDAGSAGALELSSCDGASILIRQSLGRLQGGSASNLRVNVGEEIGSVSFFQMFDSRIYAGVRPLLDESSIPASVADFVGSSMIRRFRLQSGSGSGDVVVAARTIRSAFLGVVDLSLLDTDLVVVADDLGGATALITHVYGKPSRRTRIAAMDEGVRELGPIELRAV